MNSLQDLLNTPFGGILGVIHVVLSLYALYNIFASHMDMLSKILWAIVVIVFPIFGLLAYLLF